MSGSEQPAQPAQRPPVEQMTRVRRTRSPKWGVFIGLGVLVGVLVAGAATFALPVTDEYGYGTVLAYTALVLALVGGLLGGVVALLLDRR
jgi:hypothetical protein